MEHFAAFVGIDWSDQKHDVCLVDVVAGKRQKLIINHTPQALDEWATQLRTRFAGGKIAVCLEQSRGPLIFALLKYDFLVLYPINPTTRGPRIVKRSLPRGPKMIHRMPSTWLNY
ncbi:MAG: IS110 family transposase [Acidobacteria bacterium]|nr:IS110 family transposase [Acidobacteriota bacterium]